MTGKGNCDYCCKHVDFETKEEIIDVDMNGMEFSYEALVPYCKECGNEIYVGKVNDLNIIRAYKAQKEMLERGC